MKKKKKLIIQILFDAITTYLKKKTKVNQNKTKSIKINKICKKVPRWSYKYMNELEQLTGKVEADTFQIRSRKAKRVVILPNKSNFL